MEVPSSDDVGLVLVSDGFGRGLEAQISSFLVCGKEMPPQKPPSRGEERLFTFYRLVRARVVLVEDPLLPDLARGLIPERQPL